jgi:hypothetical protein
VPVDAHGGRVVVELAVRGLEDGVNDVLHGFPRVLVRAGRDKRFDVEVGSVALARAEDIGGGERRRVLDRREQVSDRRRVSASTCRRRRVRF